MKCSAFGGDQDSNYFELHICMFVIFIFISVLSELSLPVLFIMDIINYVLKGI